MSHNEGAADKSFIIETPFTKEDIDKLVMKLPSNKAPGPDGFNRLFLKICWHIIKEDIYQLCFNRPFRDCYHKVGLHESI